MNFKNHTVMDWKNDSRIWYNPFNYIAGEKALAAGLLIILLTSVTGTFSGIWFPGILDIKISYSGTFSDHLLISLLMWIILVAVLFATGLVLSSSRIRLIDMAGTLALARAPVLIAAITGFFGVTERVLLYWVNRILGGMDGFILPEQTLEKLPDVVYPWETTLAIVLLMLQLLVVIWMVALMYNAFRVSANLKGMRAGVGFAIALLTAQIISNVLVFILF
jgi:hypothetical protein